MTQPDDNAPDQRTPEELLAALSHEIGEAHATGDTSALVSKLPPLLNILMRPNGPTSHGWMLIAVPFDDSKPEDVRFATNVSREGVLQLVKYAQLMIEQQKAPAPNGGEGGNAPRH